MPKCYKAWTVAIWHDQTAFSQRPSNRGMVVESAMSAESMGPNEMGGGGGGGGGEINCCIGVFVFFN